MFMKQQKKGAVSISRWHLDLRGKLLEPITKLPRIVEAPWSLGRQSSKSPIRSGFHDDQKDWGIPQRSLFTLEQLKSVYLIQKLEPEN